MEEWQAVFKKNLPSYVQLILESIQKQGGSSLVVSETLTKLPFNLPRGLVKKEISIEGKYPVVSQSKELIIGYSDDETLLISKSLPLVIYGDHSKTIKYIDFPFIIGADGVKLLKPSQNLYTKYYYYCLIGIETSTKSYGRHFSLLKKKEIVIPKEQKTQRSIVSFIEDLEKNSLKSGEYFSKKVEGSILTLHLNHLRNQSMANELFHQQTLLKKLRQQILQEAIEGKLTVEFRIKNEKQLRIWNDELRQATDPESIRELKLKIRDCSESAASLLSRIKAEKEQLIKDKKIKKQKDLPQITDEEKPFDLPDGWVWCRLEEVGLFERGKSKHRPRNDECLFIDGKYPFVQTGDVARSKKHGFRVNAYSKLYNEFGLSQSRLWNAGTLCITIAANIAETGFLDIEACFPDSVVGFTSLVDYETSFYVKYFIDATRDEIEKFAPATAQKNINLGIINMLSFPLPSLLEQKEIIAKVERLFAICDRLETQVTQNQTHAEQLMQAVLKEAFQQDSSESQREMMYE